MINEQTVTPFLMAAICLLTWASFWLPEPSAALWDRWVAFVMRLYVWFMRWGMLVLGIGFLVYGIVQVVW
jgi:hypothetical protein